MSNDNTFNAITTAFDSVFSFTLNTKIEIATGFIINPVTGYNCDDGDADYCQGRVEAMAEILKCFNPKYEEKLEVAAEIVAANLVKHFRSVVDPEAGADEPLQLLLPYDRINLVTFVMFTAFEVEDTSSIDEIGTTLLNA